MSLWGKLEQRVGGLIEGLFSRAFRGRVHPMEIADRLVREIEDQRTFSVSTVYVPNEFIVRLHPEDLAYLRPLEEALRREIEQYVQQYVEQRGYALVGRPRLILAEAERGHPGSFNVESLMVERPPEALLIGLTGPVAGTKFRVEQDCVRLGRAPENDLVIEDHNLSRFHAQIIRQKEGFVVVDLGSTNGTYVNGQKVSQAALRDGDEIAVGLSCWRFEER